MRPQLLARQCRRPASPPSRGSCAKEGRDWVKRKFESEYPSFDAVRKSCSASSACFAISGLAFLRRGGRLVLVDGQPDFEAGFAWTGLKLNFAAMSVTNDAVADDQAKAGTGADRFGGEKRFEHVRLHLRRNAGAVVHDFDDELIVLQGCADTDFARALDGVDRVINEIGPYLIEFAAISHNARHGAIEGPNERDVLQFVTQHGQGALDSFMDVHLLHR